MSTNDSTKVNLQPAAENTHNDQVIKLKFEKASQYALNRLQTELPANLFYHRLGHTRDDVVPSARILAGMEGISGDLFYLLLTAAWFHDLGFIEHPDKHELTSARIASQVLPKFGYSARQVKIVKETVYATILPQSPKTHLEMILADADLNVLGREDFMQRSSDLRCERAHFGNVFTEVEWYTSQLKFLENHSFFTKSANALYNPQKRINITALKNTIKEAASKEEN